MKFLFSFFTLGFVFLEGSYALQKLPASEFLEMIYIYVGKGASEVAVKHTHYTLKKLVSPHYKIHFISPDEVRKGNWVRNAALFVMPGGADIPYMKDLNGQGNNNIRKFVQGGGAYLGLCAGAYYGSRQVKFSLGTPLEVKGERELAFFPGTAEGPTLKPYDYQTNAGAEAATLQWANSQVPITAYFNGGCHFVDASKVPHVTVLAHYATSPRLAAIVKIDVGKGHVILSGVHCEFAPELLDMTDPYLIPVKEKLLPSDPDRLAVMAHILKSLSIKLNKGV